MAGGGAAVVRPRLPARAMGSVPARRSPPPAPEGQHGRPRPRRAGRCWRRRG